MKKLWLLPVLAVVLAACGNDDDDQPKKDDEISVDTVVPEKDTTKQDTTETKTDGAEPSDSELKPEKDTEDQPPSSSSDLSAYEEAASIEEHVPVNELTSRVATDNPGKRILLFENASGKKVYKSIFIKHDRYLKIIDLKEDRLVHKGQL